MHSHKYKQAGFSYIELLIAITLIAIFVTLTIPLYKHYAALTELKNTAQSVRDIIRTSQNHALTGVVPTSGKVSHWAVRLKQTLGTYQYESAACEVVTDSATTGYADRYTFESCPGRSDYELFGFPQYLSINHQYTGEEEANLFFANITGKLVVYDSSGNILGNTIDIKISSLEYPELYVLLHVNSDGTITEEKIIN